jgi:hypothetical protein
MSNVLNFDNFRLTEDGFEFDAVNEYGHLALMYSKEWIDDQVGNNADFEAVRKFFLEHQKKIENAAIARVGASSALGKPLGDLPYSGFATAPFDQLIVRGS